jgi:hypothetical protein
VKPLAIAMMLLSLAGPLLCAQQASLSADARQEVTTSVDWETERLHVTISRPVPQEGPNVAAAVSRVRGEIQRDAGPVLVSAMRALVYDSLQTVDELITSDEEHIRDLAAAAAAAQTADARATPDLNSVVVEFVVDLRAQLLPALLNHERPLPLEPLLKWIPTTEYTGIVIYAADPLLVHGTDRMEYVQPALFPGLYYMNETGDGILRLMEAEHVSAESVRKWGPVLYSPDVADAEFSERAGARPLRIVAYRAFGRYPTDVVISNGDAMQILANENNRSLIAEGRVVLVLDSEALE